MSQPMLPVRDQAPATASHVVLGDSAEVLSLIVRRYPLRISGYDVAKRVFDLMVGVVGLLIALPVMVVIAVLIRWDSPGPILFRQKRIARGGRLFTIYKFRTMWHDSPSRFPGYFDFSFRGQANATIYLQHDDDPRVTRLGRFLRRSSLDELPNLWNVVWGDMSLVGPRPEIPEVLPHYRDTQLLKFSVKPGLTGLAQITGRGELSLAETIEADLQYCERRSFVYDLWILIATVREVVRGSGAY